MGYIHFNLINSGHCGGMAPVPVPGGAFAPAALLPGMSMAGAYMIVNTNTNNRYIGISTNIQNRFNTRLGVITEMGFSALQMARIGIIWGNTYVKDLLPPVLIWPAGAVLPGGVPVAPAGGPFIAIINGTPINLEQLLIRFVISMLGAGGTVSNNAMAAAPYVNPTPNPITVRVSWGAMGGLFAANEITAVWPNGVGW